MNEIITNGTEIKQRVISEIAKATISINVAMAWFTDRDIANTIIDAKKRNVDVDIILSSNSANETVKLMFLGANIAVHAFDTGDERGILHHRFCLLDGKISINGSYNFSYNASNNNVENIHVSDNIETYSQLFSEFERIKYNIAHELNVSIDPGLKVVKHLDSPPANIIDVFSQQVQNLVYSSAEINAEEYKLQGFSKSKESGGNPEIFKVEYNNIKEKIRVFATDDGLSSKRSILSSNVTNAFEGKKSEIENNKESEVTFATQGNELEKRQLEGKATSIKSERSILETGNERTGDRGLLEIKLDIEKKRLEKKTLEESFIVRRFWTVGRILVILLALIFVYYLSIFFSSALYKVFFEGNIIRSSLENGINPGVPQLVDGNAILKIFRQQGVLFGTIAMLFFIIPVLLSNLELLGSDRKWVNSLGFWVGVLVFDIVVSIMVALNTDEIKTLLMGRESNLKIWEVVKLGEFWLIFAFGMLPLIITHFIISYLFNAYNGSKPEIVDAEKNRKIHFLEVELLDLAGQRETIEFKLKEHDAAIKVIIEKLADLERQIHEDKNRIELKFAETLKQLRNVFDELIAKILSGKIFTEVILDSVVASYRTGFIGYLPNFYAEVEVKNRVREIEMIVANN